jgi:AraC family transcriptional regulator
MQRHPDLGTARAPAARTLCQGGAWSVTEYICTCGPADRPFEERREQFSIAAVIEGTFRHRGDTGTAVLHPGAFLLGNAASCYECSHDHSTGDRCIAFHFAPAYFGEVAASVAGTGRFRFPTAMLPALPKLLPWLARIEARTSSADRLALDEAVPQLLEAAIGAVSSEGPRPLGASARDARRISDALRYIELNAADALDLDTLAAVAVMSKYHFLRTFRRIVGLTPYQFLLGVRMRRAAVQLATSREPVSAIAFDTGFADLSTFNARFRGVFGVSPTIYRRREGAHLLAAGEST